jgi:hypothetical protein
MTEQAMYEILLRDKFTGPLERLEQKMNGFESKLNTINAGSLMKFASGMGLAFGATEIIQGIGAAGTKIVQLGANMEQTRITFETMLGSVEKSNAAIAMMKKYAESTPFSQKEVIDSTKSLLAYGFTMGDVTKQMTMMGDIASGLNIPMGELTYLYGTLRAQGKAMTKDIQQFAGRGIPILEALQDVLGVKSTGAVQDLVTAGKVGFAEVEKAFEKMTNGSGKFAGLMEKQSKSLAGRWSTFQDIIESSATTMGEKMIPALGGVLDWMTEIAREIPNLNFEVITSQFEYLWETGTQVINLFSDLFQSMGINTDGIFTLQNVVQYLGWTMRVATTPIRIMANTLKLVGTTITAIAPLVKEFGATMKNITTGNWGGLGDNARRIKAYAGDFKATMAATIDTIAEKEAEGWQKIFTRPDRKKSEDATYDWTAATKNKYPGGTDPDKKKSSGIGVEKVQAGTRNVVVNIQTLKLADSIISQKADLSDARMLEQLRRLLLTAVNDVNMVQN